MYNYVYFNDNYEKDLGLRTVRRPNIKVPEFEIEEVNVEGRKEPLIRKKRAKKLIEIPVDFDFVDRENWQETARIIKKWLNEVNNNKLIFYDDADKFYKVKYATSNIERKKHVGEFQVIFVCSPYTYLEEGTYEQEINDGTIIYNDWLQSEPLYEIKGEGLIEISVNGRAVKIDVGQEVKIDTEKMICFKNDRMINITFKSGKFSDLYLDHGENIINLNVVSGSIEEVKIITNFVTN